MFFVSSSYSMNGCDHHDTGSIFLTMLQPQFQIEYPHALSTVLRRLAVLGQQTNLEESRLRLLDMPPSDSHQWSHILLPAGQRYILLLWARVKPLVRRISHVIKGTSNSRILQTSVAGSYSSTAERRSPRLQPPSRPFCNDQNPEVTWNRLCNLTETNRKSFLLTTESR